MQDENFDDSHITARPPQGWQETLTANCRPQPAIPSVLVFFISVVLPIVVFGVTAESTSVFVYLIPLGILVSAGLAVASGFCSLFPQSFWILLGLWGEDLAMRGSIPVYNVWAFRIGVIAMVIMIGVQMWRVRTGKFVPMIRELPEESYD